MPPPPVSRYLTGVGATLLAFWCCLAVPPPPEGLEHETPLSPADYADKREDVYLTGLPLWNYDTNFGHGFGARAYLYHNATRQDPFFGYTPYRHRVFLQAFATTKGLQFHWLDYDGPYLGDSFFRLRAQALYVRALEKNYFGVGEAATAPLSFPGAERDYVRFSAYQAALDEVRDGKTLARFDKVDHERPQVLLSLERELLGGRLRPFVGVSFSYNRLRDYSGREVEVGGGELRMGETRLSLDCAAGRVHGCSGGWDNTVRLALSFDTRDFEPDPNRGVYAEISGELATPALGSEYSYRRGVVAVRGYVSPAPELADLVLAARGVLQLQSREAPFFSMNVLPFVEDERYGIGGARTLRGYKQDRFIGPVMTLANLELRWTVAKTELLGQSFGFMLVPFVDWGMVYDTPRDLALDGWRRAQGAAIRIAWNQATVVMVDYGFSREDSGLYINFTHIF